MANTNVLPGTSVAGLVRSAAPCAAAFMVALAAFWSPAAADAAKESEGASLYRQHCASCHGGTGRGDGPVAKRLTPPPPALTTLARRHGGVFPTDYVYRIVDGREERRAHGGRSMPVWGTYYGLQAQGSGRDAPDTETAIRQRILALVGHLESIQVGYTTGAGAADATRDLLARHLEAFGARDRDALMESYTDDAVLVIPSGPLTGRDEIGGYYDALFAEFAKPGAAFNLLEQTVVDNMAHIVWSGETADRTFKRTAETFAVEDGKIRYQITAFETAAK